MNSNVKRIRVAIVISHPVQHFVYLYKALAKQSEINLKVFFASKIGVKSYHDRDMNVEIQWAADLLGGYESEFLPEAEAINSTGFWQINNPSIIAALDSFSPDVVQLHGYSQLTLLRALLWCKVKRIPVLLWSDSSLLYKRAAWKETLKGMLLPRLLSHFSGVLSTGNNNAIYYKRYGMNPKDIFPCPFTVDELALSKARDGKSAIRMQLRAHYQISADEIVLLFVGKLVSWKRPQDLLEALKRSQQILGAEVKLLAFFAGDGAMRNKLVAQARTKNLRAIFAGFINVDILPNIYAMADVLVFPSEKEPYGLSAREAICVGLPLIVSDQIGCIGSNDAARPEQNALVYPSMNGVALSDAIVDLVSNPVNMQNMATASLAIAHEMISEQSVAGFIDAVKSVHYRR